MTIEENYHHERCPMCEQRFLGFTDADMVVHFMRNHPEYQNAVATKLGIPQKKRTVCGSCNREYVTIQGECPWCYHRGPPYK